MPTFVRAVSRLVDYNYVLVIDSIPAMSAYWIAVRSNRTAADFSDALQGKETKATEYIALYRDKTGDCLIEATLGVANRVFDGMCRAIRANGRIYIQKAGSWFVPSPGLITHNPRKTDTYTFPEVKPEIRIFRWPKGKHWYATVDGQEVVDVEGRQKWDFQFEAHAAVGVFLFLKKAGVADG